MSEAVWLAIVTGMPATLTGVAACIVAWRNRVQTKEMHKENAAAIAENREAVTNLDKHLNGNLERIVAQAVAGALAKERLAVLKREKD